PPYLRNTPPPARSSRSIGSGSAGASTCPSRWGATGSSDAPASAGVGVGFGASSASSASTNSPSSFSETCCSIELPNCASLPTIFRSVSTVTRLRSPSACSCAETVAAALPVPRASLPRASMIARYSTPSCSTKCTLPWNSLVTGPTLTFTLPSTSQACSTGALTVNSLAIFIEGPLGSGRAVPGQRGADQVAVIGGLGQRADALQRAFGVGVHQVGHTECGQRGHPVDGLGHPGW